MHHKINPYWRT